MTLFNVWDYLITAEEVKQMYLGPGTERGNSAAWVDLMVDREKYLHGYTAFRNNPVLKWKGSPVFFSINLCTNSLSDKSSIENNYAVGDGLNSLAA